MGNFSKFFRMLNFLKNWNNLNYFVSQGVWQMSARIRHYFKFFINHILYPRSVWLFSTSVRHDLKFVYKRPSKALKSVSTGRKSEVLNTKREKRLFERRETFWEKRRFPMSSTYNAPHDGSWGLFIGSSCVKNRLIKSHRYFCKTLILNCDFF